MLRRVLILAYGTASYALCLVTLLYAVGFVGGFATPTWLDGPRQPESTAAALRSRRPALPADDLGSRQPLSGRNEDG